MTTEKLLIFDCDGTLVDSEGIANQVFLEAVNDLGIPVTEQEAWDHFPGTSMALCIKYVEETYQVRLPQDFVDIQRKRQRIEFKNRLQPIQGITLALNRLPHKKCVASNGPMEVIQTNLKTTGLDQHFEERIFSAYVLEKWKPEPDLFLHAAETLGHHSDDCIVIEDSLAGMQAGLNAGMTVLAYVPPHHPYKVDLAGVLTFEDMSYLPDMVASLDIRG
jgi:HAD superfamily hydrolase (TIGR01509 family)